MLAPSDHTAHGFDASDPLQHCFGVSLADLLQQDYDGSLLHAHPGQLVMV
jgi:hypothetical protein